MIIKHKKSLYETKKETGDSVTVCVCGYRMKVFEEEKSVISPLFSLHCVQLHTLITRKGDCHASFSKQCAIWTIPRGNRLSQLHLTCFRAIVTLPWHHGCAADISAEWLQKNLSAIVRIAWHFMSEKQFLHFKLSSKPSTSPPQSLLKQFEQERGRDKSTEKTKPGFSVYLC